MGFRGRSARCRRRLCGTCAARQHGAAECSAQNEKPKSKNSRGHRTSLYQRPINESRRMSRNVPTV